MPEKVIKDILLEAGVYSWALAQCGSEAELMRLFTDDFEGLMKLCQQ